ncbi:MAG TPA: secretin and TonB N-terminal domain-containing protein [Thermoanaerobaculia bacterium]|nr:secretin and TonB N-terminal domain-containing protein [Thermoanaerobaculia bacterium]
MLAVEPAARPSAKEVSTRLDREGAVRAPFEATGERVPMRWLGAAALAAFALVAGAIVFSGREAHHAEEAGTPPPAAPAPKVVPQEPAARESPPSYSGQPISLDLEDADIRDVALTLARLSGLSVAIDPDVEGRVDAHFQNVPWDQAFDLFLKQNGLTYRIEGNVLRVSRPTDPSPPKR